MHPICTDSSSHMRGMSLAKTCYDSTDFAFLFRASGVSFVDGNRARSVSHRGGRSKLVRCVRNRARSALRKIDFIVHDGIWD